MDKLSWVLRSFNYFQRKSEDLARASREQSDVAAQAANKVITGAKGTNNLANSPSTVFTDEFDASVAALNIVRIMWHLTSVMFIYTIPYIDVFGRSAEINSVDLLIMVPGNCLIPPS